MYTLKLLNKYAAQCLVLGLVLWVLPLIAVGQPEWKDVVLKNGRRIGLAASAQTVQYYIQDPITGDKVLRKEELGRTPLTVDGEKIYSIREVKTNKPESEVWNYLIDQIIEKLQGAKLPDGKGWFYLHNIVMDKDGKIIYCDMEGHKIEDKDGIVRLINAHGHEKILTDAPRIVGKVDNKPVYMIIGTGEGKVNFRVSKSKVSFTNN